MALLDEDRLFPADDRYAGRSRAVSMRASARCPSSARTATPRPPGSRATSPSRIRSSSSSSPTTTSSACSTARASPWRSWRLARTRSKQPREVWRIFSSHYHLFRGTPTRLWLDYAFQELFGLTERLSERTAEHYLRHHRAETGHAGVPAPRPLRAFRDRGAGHNRFAAGHARRSRSHPALRLERPHPAHLPSRSGGRSAVSRFP